MSAAGLLRLFEAGTQLSFMTSRLRSERTPGRKPSSGIERVGVDGRDMLPDLATDDVVSSASESSESLLCQASSA